MDSEIDLAWSHTPYFLEFETCPIKLIASSGVSETARIDEVIIYSDVLWSKICRYKGSEIPYTLISFEIDGKRLLKTALKSNLSVYGHSNLEDASIS